MIADSPADTARLQPGKWKVRLRLLAIIPALVIGIVFGNYAMEWPHRIGREVIVDGWPHDGRSVLAVRDLEVVRPNQNPAVSCGDSNRADPSVQIEAGARATVRQELNGLVCVSILSGSRAGFTGWVLDRDTVATDSLRPSYILWLGMAFCGFCLALGGLSALVRRAPSLLKPRPRECFAEMAAGIGFIVMAAGAAVYDSKLAGNPLVAPAVLWFGLLLVLVAAPDLIRVAKRQRRVQQHAPAELPQGQASANG